MKFGVISDIHGNIIALETVLNELKKENVDKILCLGDIIGIGPHPNECIKALISLGNQLIVVRGNHEGYFLNGIPKIIHDEKMKMSSEEIAHHQWVASCLSDESKALIREMKEEIVIECERKKIAMMHYPLNHQFGKYQRHVAIPTYQDAMEIFCELDADVYLFGHTHQKNTLHEAGKWFINPGALGCPKGTNHAPYGILRIDENGVNYLEYEAEYDVENVIQDMKKLQYPDADMVLRVFYGK